MHAAKSSTVSSKQWPGKWQQGHFRRAAVFTRLSWKRRRHTNLQRRANKQEGRRRLDGRHARIFNRGLLVRVQAEE